MQVSQTLSLNSNESSKFKIKIGLQKSQILVSVQGIKLVTFDPHPHYVVHLQSISRSSSYLLSSDTSEPAAVHSSMISRKRFLGG